MTEKQAAALNELNHKTLAQIQRETSVIWATRAWAAKMLSENSTTTSEMVRWMLDAKEYEHEAIEHAALCATPGAIETARAIIDGIIRP